MNDIFAREDKVIMDAQNILDSNILSSTSDAGHYENLLDEYKKMLKQMKTMVKMSDIMQGRLNTLSIELERLSTIDELTQLNNRRSFNEKYAKVWSDACLTHIPLGILMLDIDFFKNYNDTYGHLEGDKCLQKIAGIIKSTVNRFDDFAARFGGEEFVILLPNTEIDGCIRIAENIMHNISLIEIGDTGDKFRRGVTVSIGINSVIPDDTINTEELLNGADKALYKAKEEGRNCYRII